MCNSVRNYGKLYLKLQAKVKQKGILHMMRKRIKYIKWNSLLNLKCEEIHDVSGVWHCSPDIRPWGMSTQEIRETITIVERHVQKGLLTDSILDWCKLIYRVQEFAAESKQKSLCI